jgi:ribonuclease P protein component
VGGAVIRNRLRRRLRAISSEVDFELMPGAYLINVSPPAAALSYDELRKNVSIALLAVLEQGAK